MSYYYEYYIGYKKDDKIYPWGPFTADGKIRSVICRPRSSASDLHTDFYSVKNEEISDELRAAFEHEDWKGNKVVDVKWLPVSALPNGSYIKKGYFLIDDVKAYEEDYDWFEGFYDVLSPQVYIALLDKELRFGKNQPEKDCEGNEYTEHNASDYMFYTYPDYHCREYEAHVLRETVDSLESYRLISSGDVEWVVLETEG